MSQRNKPNEIYITRMYDAPVKLVWEAWTDVKQVAQWWGPRGFTITTHSKDLRAGGHWAYTMHGPDGTNWENKTIYHVVEKYSKLIYDHGGNDDRPPLFKVTVTFEEIKGKTKMDMTMALETAEAAEQTKKFIKQASGNSTWDRLGEYLEKEINGKDKFVINRTFEASRDLLFKLWTDPAHVQKWLPPTGMEMKYIKADIKPGGSSFYEMFNKDMKMFGKAHYIEIVVPEKLVYTQIFCDEKENISRHPMAAVWPETMLTTILFSEEGPNLTRVTVTWEIHGKATPEEIAFFVQARAGMTGGWTGSFDKLEDYLKKQ